MSYKVARNVSTLVISKLVAGVLVLIGYASIFRYLGTFHTGEYQFALAYVLLFGVVVDFGIQQLVIKKVSENKELAEQYLGNFFAVEFVLALFVYGLLMAIAVYNHYDPVVLKLIAMIGFGMFLNALSDPHTSIISAFEDMHLLALMNFFDSIINVCVMFAMIVFHQPVLFMGLVQILMGLAHMIVYNIVIRRYVSHINLFKYLRALDIRLMGNMLYSALPFGVLVGFSIVYNKIDVIILSHIRGYSETGIYTAAYKFFDFMSFFPAVVSSSLYPFFSSQMKQGNVSAVRDVLEKYTKFMIILAAPVAAGALVLAPKIMVLLAGQQFFAGYAALQLLVFGTAFLFIYSGVNSMIISQLTRYAVWITFANIFINAIGNLLLIPHFGFKAAALMTAVSEFVQLCCYFYFVNKKVVKFVFVRNFFVPAICAALMGLGIYQIRGMSLLVTIPAGAIVYGLLMLATGFVKKQDLASFKNILLRRGSVV